MVFSFDSSLAVCALLLFAATAFAWARAPQGRVSVALNQRFGAVLLAALAAASFAASIWSDFSGVAFAVALLVASLGATALGLSVFAHLSRPPPPLAASLCLGGGLALGLLASLSGQAVFALAAILCSAAVMLALGFGCLSRIPLKAFETILGAVALLGGGMALMQEALATTLLFFAAGLMGLACASQARVEDETDALFIKPVSRPRF